EIDKLLSILRRRRPVCAAALSASEGANKQRLNTLDELNTRYSISTAVSCCTREVRMRLVTRVVVLLLVLSTLPFNARVWAAARDGVLRVDRAAFRQDDADAINARISDLKKSPPTHSDHFRLGDDLWDSESTDAIERSYQASTFHMKVLEA